MNGGFGSVRGAVAVGVVVVVAVLAVGSAKALAAEGEPPNIIFCMTDDQGYGDAGFMGHDVMQTPELDEMAASGLRLDRYYTASAVCSPTRSSILTGRAPTRTGVFSWGNALRPQERTVATVLREAGYTTAHFGKWHLGSVRAEQPTSPDGHGFDEWLAAPNFYMLDPWMSHNGQPTQLEGDGSIAVVDAALSFIEKQTAEGDAPFIAFIHFGSPHTPHEPTEELAALYPDQPENLRNYYAEMTGVSRAMGNLRERLRELEIEDDTVLWFTSDNGGRRPEASNGELRGQKGQLWEGGIRVPAIVEWPGQIQPRTSDVVAGSVDLFPTFIDLAGADLPTDRPLDGVSLLPLLRGEMDRRGSPLGFWEYGPRQGQGMRSDAIVQQLQKVLDGEADGFNEGRLNDPDLPYEEADNRPGPAAWIDGDWKLHRRGDNYQLYNLSDDLNEQHNIIDDHPDRAEQMKQALEDWQASVVRSMRGEDY